MPLRTAPCRRLSLRVRELGREVKVREKGTGCVEELAASALERSPFGWVSSFGRSS